MEMNLLEAMEVEDQKFKTNLTTEEAMEVEDQDQDRISLLPDCLIIVILSLLGSTVEAIRTSTLSKRWQYLWTYVPNLIFSDSIHDDNHLIPDFYSFVAKTLTQCRLSSLKIFWIHARFDSQFESQVNNWIRYALNHNVQDFHLALGNKNPLVHEFEFEFELSSDIFFNNSCFTKLTLAGCSFKPTGVISWNKLTSFVISEGDFNEDLIQNLLSGCPLLETLEFHGCYGYRRIDITSRSVKKFVFNGYMTPEDRMDDIIEINAPYITSLTIEGELLLRNILLLNVSSLVQAHLDYLFGEGENDHTPCEEEEEEFFKELILGLRHVKEIKIGTLCSKVISCLEEYGFIFPSNLKVVDPTPHYIHWDESETDSDVNLEDFM